ncbi:MAG: hypothetical protein G01um101448_1167 [Parcubacteria group bacterium Gr01-1014_48]|nr:MAG: hypothetical protein Greene041614_1148 [Parcubacteria group bacterium Greene0416_14]TSC71470.1 MAG: hypothetical protein G01um101448_1167 [Parcubacteria group bacterium Gr01-1014_48]TSC99935.1 MAG: hypothetical protein Greene101415_1030 [Parcubacteria group bacterium Greene1014_15]TSD06690.1 MAG: hypothetical protein Greene07144_1118 [Parcubacteria group bacterium Greene0714_4]
MKTVYTKAQGLEYHIAQMIGGIIGVCLFVVYFSSALAAVAPTLTFSAVPANIVHGETISLTWHGSDVVYCMGSGNWNGLKSPYGTENQRPTESSVYAITCVGPAGTVAREIKVGVDEVRVVSPVLPPPAPVPAPVSPVHTQRSLSVSCVVDPTRVRVGEKVIFASGVAGGVAPLRYDWSGSVTGSGQVQKVSFTTSGVKEARITVADASGASASAACVVTVQQLAPVISKKSSQTAAAIQKPEEKKDEGSTIESNDTSKTSDTPSPIVADESEARSIGGFLSFLIYSALLLCIAFLSFGIYYFYCAAQESKKRAKAAN